MRKQCSAEEKTRIVLDGLRGEHSTAELSQCIYDGQVLAERILKGGILVIFEILHHVFW
jgi:hypothetical protein